MKKMLLQLLLQLHTLCRFSEPLKQGQEPLCCMFMMELDTEGPETMNMGSHMQGHKIKWHNLGEVSVGSS